MCIYKLVWLGIGISQWFMLSKYGKISIKSIKKMQRKIDEKLGKDKNNDRREMT